MENVQKKWLPPLRVAGIRTQGRYEACGQLFRKLSRYVGRFANGKPLCLHYSDYQPQTADFAACLPIRELSEPESRKVRDRLLDLAFRPRWFCCCRNRRC